MNEAILLRDNVPPKHQDTKFSPNILEEFGVLVNWWLKLKLSVMLFGCKSTRTLGGMILDFIIF
jgi:hypothetical protein